MKVHEDNLFVGQSVSVDVKNYRNGQRITIDDLTPKAVHYKVDGVLRKESKAVFLSRVRDTVLITKEEQAYVDKLFSSFDRAVS